MGSIDPGERSITSQPISETKRKVSIQTDPVEPRLNHDSLGYDLRRKISQVNVQQMHASHTHILVM